MGLRVQRRSGCLGLRELIADPVLSGGGLHPPCLPQPGKAGLRRPGSAPRLVAAVPPVPHPGRAATGSGVEAGLPAPRLRPQVSLYPSCPALPWGEAEQINVVKA